MNVLGLMGFVWSEDFHGKNYTFWEKVKAVSMDMACTQTQRQ